MRNYTGNRTQHCSGAPSAFGQIFNENEALGGSDDCLTTTIYAFSLLRSQNRIKNNDVQVIFIRDVCSLKFSPQVKCY